MMEVVSPETCLADRANYKLLVLVQQQASGVAWFTIDTVGLVQPPWV